MSSANQSTDGAKRVRREPLREQVARLLIGEIVRGVADPGQFIDSEQRLAERMGVSRAVMREAIMLVSTCGLVAVLHGRGAEVRPRSEWNIFDPLVIEALTESGAVVPILEDLIEARIFIELAAVELAAARASDASLLSNAVDQMDARIDDPVEFFRLDVQFHDILLQLGGNGVLMRLMEPVHDLLITARRHVSAISSTERRQGSNDGHRRIASAVAQRDPVAARSAMLDHLKLARTELDLATVGERPMRTADRETSF